MIYIYISRHDIFGVLHDRKFLSVSKKKEYMYNKNIDENAFLLW